MILTNATQTCSCGGDVAVKYSPESMNAIATIYTCQTCGDSMIEQQTFIRSWAEVNSHAAV